jgi:hypothetical protein
VAKFFQLTIERIKSVAPAAVQQDERDAFALVAIVDLDRANAGNKRRRF